MTDIVLFFLGAIVVHCVLCLIAAELWPIVVITFAILVEAFFVSFVVVLSLVCCVYSIVLQCVAASKRRFSVFLRVVPLSNLPKQ